MSEVPSTRCRPTERLAASRGRRLRYVRSMATYVMLSTIGPDGCATLTSNPQRIKQVNADVEAMGAKVLHQWALLGQWDFISIIDAPDEATMMRVATTLAARGTLKTRTLTAMSVDEYIAALGSGLDVGKVLGGTDDSGD